MKKTVLIVDDEPRNLEILVNFIQELDFSVYMTNNATKAFEISEKRVPDVVITDWEMPQINGIELVKMLKASDITKEIPVIICTGVMMSSQNLKTALDAGAVDFIRKPIDFVELTARLKSALRLSESLMQIKQLNANKDRMFEIIAHDLSGPVGHVYSILSPDVINALDAKKYSEFLVSARSSISATYSLLQNLLSWARSQRNKIEFFPKKNDMNFVIEDTINLLQASSDDKKIKLTWYRIESLFAFFDSNMILTVLRNLINNAIKFTKEGGEIKIITEVSSHFVTVKIEDNGIGITKENMQKIQNKIPFTCFGTNREKGSGLGLQLCRDFVAINKGQFLIESQENQGSCFSFTLPLNQI